MKYELINPSDPIFFEAPNLKIATLACLYVGNGSYGAKPEDGSEEVPLLIFGWRKWWAEKYDTDPMAEATENAVEIAKALRSFHIQDGRERSSLNDICARAHADADSIEKVALKV
jgi:hypothetical protein